MDVHWCASCSCGCMPNAALIPTARLADSMLTLGLMCLAVATTCCGSLPYARPQNEGVVVAGACELHLTQIANTVRSDGLSLVRLDTHALALEARSKSGGFDAGYILRIKLQPTRNPSACLVRATSRSDNVRSREWAWEFLDTYARQYGASGADRFLLGETPPTRALSAAPSNPDATFASLSEPRAVQPTRRPTPSDETGSGWKKDGAAATAAGPTDKSAASGRPSDSLPPPPPAPVGVVPGVFRTNIHGDLPPPPPPPPAR